MAGHHSSRLGVEWCPRGRADGRGLEHERECVQERERDKRDEREIVREPFYVHFLPRRPECSERGERMGAAGNMPPNMPPPNTQARAHPGNMPPRPAAAPVPQTPLADAFFAAAGDLEGKLQEVVRKTATVGTGSAAQPSLVPKWKRALRLELGEGVLTYYVSYSFYFNFMFPATVFLESTIKTVV